jgi:hypothetical protein
MYKLENNEHNISDNCNDGKDEHDDAKDAAPICGVWLPCVPKYQNEQIEDNQEIEIG